MGVGGVVGALGVCGLAVSFDDWRRCSWGDWSWLSEDEG